LHVVNIARFLKGLLVEFEVCPKGPAEFEVNRQPTARRRQNRNIG